MTAGHGFTVASNPSGGRSLDEGISEWDDQSLNQEHFSSGPDDQRGKIMNESARPPRKGNSRRNAKKMDASIIAVMCAWIVEHQIGQTRWLAALS